MARSRDLELSQDIYPHASYSIDTFATDTFVVGTKDYKDAPLSLSLPVHTAHLGMTFRS